MKKLSAIVLGIMALLCATGPAAAERLSVSANTANIRSSPDTASAVMWQVEKYQPLNIIQKQGDWYLFEDFEGDRGWIHKSLLSTEKTVVVKNDTCNVRSGPGTEHDIRFTVDRGVPFKVLAEKGDWLHVIHADGDEGWIHKALVW
jgi:SH3-like domain-containing protein